MRKTAIVFGVLLACSVAANVFLLRRVVILHNAIQSDQWFLKRAGQSAGRIQAGGDFAAGKPLWYVVGDFGGDVPEDKPGRKPTSVGCLVSEYEVAFVDSYNKTMDELFARKTTRGK